jgi:hypothetical protein
MAKRYRFVYYRPEGQTYFRGFEPLGVIRHIVADGTYRNQPVRFIRWQSGNYDFSIQRPRVEAQETTLSELWYRSEWEPLDTASLTSA